MRDNRTMRMRWITVALAAACGSHHGGNGQYERFELDPALATVTVPLDGNATQAYHVYGITGSTGTDVTSSCTLTVDPAFGMFAASTLTIAAHGGKTTVTANCDGDVVVTGELVVTLDGTVVLGAAPANAPGLFTSATLGSDPTRTPPLQYPLDGAVSPVNIPPIEVQWAAAGNDLFHVAITSSFAHVDAYTTDVQATLSDTEWSAIAGTAAGDQLGFVVEGLAQAAPAMKYASAVATIDVSHDSIDKTAIYYWASSAGDIMTETFGDVNGPQVVKNNCTACHSLSRTGTRIGYSRCVANNCNNLYAGFMHFDPGTQSWVETVNADMMQIHGSYTTFAPLGNPFSTDDQSLAIVSMVNGTLSLYDPDTGAAIASNLDAVTQPPGGSALMADWSADGSSIVFASTPNPGQWIDLSGSSIAVSTYSFTNGQHVFGTPHPLVTGTITLPTGAYTNFFFPSYSPDNALIVFDAAHSAWRDAMNAYTPAARLMLADPGGAGVRDLAALNGGASVDNTWAHWAPTISSDYYWIVFSSERDYGHEVTAANTNPTCINVGVHQCKQLWIGAISKSKLAAGVDPSAPPMWLPGQDFRTDNISPYWTVPAGVF